MSHLHDLVRSKLITAIAITATVFVVELIGGFIANSLALQADAGHMLTDVAALSLSLLGFLIGNKKANQEKTFGYKRTEIVVALLNGIFLWILALYISYEAVLRFIQSETVNGEILLGVSLLGLAANLVTAYILHSHSHDNLNVRGAFLHVLGDILGSVGAVIAGICVLLWNMTVADPVVSIVISALIIYSSWNLVRDSLHILLEGTPKNIDLNEIEKELQTISGISSVHDLHVWSITSGVYSLSCHVVAADITKTASILTQTRELLDRHFKISHATIQIEPAGFDDCHDCGTKNLTEAVHDHHH